MASIFLLSPSSNGSSCFKKPYDVPDCRAKASQGDAQAQYFLGTFYLEGREGLEADYKKTLELYTKAAEQGHVWAQFNLGLMYKDGQYLKEKPTRAAKWFLEAAKSGHANAQYVLGALYLVGEGVPKDIQMIYLFWNLAASNGHDKAKIAIKSLTKKMSQTELRSAKSLLSKWKEKYTVSIKQAAYEPLLNKGN